MCSRLIVDVRFLDKKKKCDSSLKRISNNRFSDPVVERSRHREENKSFAGRQEKNAYVMRTRKYRKLEEVRISIADLKKMSSTKSEEFCDFRAKNKFDFLLLEKFFCT